MFRDTNNMIERQSESRRARTLTVIEPALASPLVSWVAGSVPACQPVCHQHCLVFSLRPSAFSLYTLSCSGLTCFLYINIFITAQMASFSALPRTEGQRPAWRCTLRRTNISPETFFIPHDAVIRQRGEETNDHGGFYQSDRENPLIQ